MNKYEIQITNPKTGYTGTIIINTSHGNKIREIAENKLYNYINIKPQLLTIIGQNITKNIFHNLKSVT